MFSSFFSSSFFYVNFGFLLLGGKLFSGDLCVVACDGFYCVKDFGFDLPHSVNVSVLEGAFRIYYEGKKDVGRETGGRRTTAD